MANMPEKFITKKIKYSEHEWIGRVPEKIARKGIVVASSNNGAVQNIVNELPLISGIDHEELYKKKRDEHDMFWGLFSLEGGRKENMNYIVTVLKHVVDYLENEYLSDEGIYQEFQKQYEEVRAYRQERQDICEKINTLSRLKKEADEKQRLFEEKEETEEALGDWNQQLSRLQDDRNSIEQCIEALNLQKPGFFSPRKTKQEFREKLRLYSDQLQQALMDEREIKTRLFENERQQKQLQDELSKNEKEIEKSQAAFERWKQFLYENRKSMKKAYLIWGKQNSYLDHKEAISEAWNWINLVIPVISSTFASFSRMCANLEEGTIWCMSSLPLKM